MHRAFGTHRTSSVRENKLTLIILSNSELTKELLVSSILPYVLAVYLVAKPAGHLYSGAKVVAR
jgi:hypothetical protein